MAKKLVALALVGCLAVSGTVSLIGAEQQPANYATARSVMLSPQITLVPSVYSGASTEHTELFAAYNGTLSPQLQISELTEILLHSVEKRSNRIDTMDDLTRLNPNKAVQIMKLNTELATWRLRSSEVDLRNNPEQMREFKSLFREKLEQIVTSVASPYQGTDFFVENDFSPDPAIQVHLDLQLMQAVKADNALSSAQRMILQRWLGYSLHNAQKALSVLNATSDEDLPTNKAETAARIRAGYRELIPLIKKYSHMVDAHEVNPDAVSLRLKQDDTRTQVRIDNVHMPDGTTRRANIISFPLKADPFHLGHLITIFNALIHGKADKLIIMSDNFDDRKPSLTSLVLRELSVRVMVRLMNTLIGKEVVVYTPWMRHDRENLPDGEHVLPEIIATNARTNRDAITNARWYHLAGSDHQHIAYPLLHASGLDSIGKMVFLKQEFEKTYSIKSNELEMGLIFNGRPGEVAAPLMTEIQAHVSNLPIITTIQHLFANSTDIRDNGIWAFMPCEIAVMAKMLHVPRWEPAADISATELQTQLERAATVIEHLKTIMGSTDVIDANKIKALLGSLRGVALQEIDSFLGITRNAVLAMPTTTATVGLESILNRIPDKRINEQVFIKTGLGELGWDLSAFIATLNTIDYLMINSNSINHVTPLRSQAFATAFAKLAPQYLARVIAVLEETASAGKPRLSERYENFYWLVIDRNFVLRRIEEMREILFAHVDHLWQLSSENSDFLDPTSATIERRLKSRRDDLVALFTLAMPDTEHKILSTMVETAI